jgi:AraC family transcriptional regulator
MHLADTLYAPRLIQPRHAHAATSCSLLLTGSLREGVGRQEAVAQPLEIVIKPADTEHSDEFGIVGARLIRITLPAGEASEDARWSAHLQSWRWVPSSPALRLFLELAVALHAKPADEAASRTRLDALAWDALAALAVDGPVAGGVAPAWLHRIREAIDDSASSLRVSSLARVADVHPVYLARQFRRYFGTSVSAYVQRLRIRRAAQRIAERRERLSSIACEAGFSDQAHMCRSFRRETGLTPGAYRQLTTEVASVQYVAPLQP